MNILLVSSKYPPEYSGSGHRASWLYRRLVAAYPELKVQVLAGSEEHNDCAVYGHEGLPVQRIAGKPCLGEKPGGARQYWVNARNFGAEYAAAAAWLEAQPRPSLVHAFGQSTVVTAALVYARKLGLPVLLELCNELDSPWPYVPPPFRLWRNPRPRGGGSVHPGLHLRAPGGDVPAVRPARGAHLVPSESGG